MITICEVKTARREVSSLGDAAKVIGAEGGRIIKSNAWCGEDTLIAYFWGFDDGDLVWALSFETHEDKHKKLKHEQLCDTLAGEAATAYQNQYVANIGDAWQINSYDLWHVSTGGIRKHYHDYKDPEEQVIKDFVKRMEKRVGMKEGKYREKLQTFDGIPDEDIPF